MRKYKWIRGLSIFGIIVVSVLICVTLFVGMMLDGGARVTYDVESMREIEAALKGNGEVEVRSDGGMYYFDVEGMVEVDCYVAFWRTGGAIRKEYNDFEGYSASYKYSEDPKQIYIKIRCLLQSLHIPQDSKGTYLTTVEISGNSCAIYSDENYTGNEELSLFFDKEGYRYGIYMWSDRREMQPVTIDREMFLETASGLIENMYR